MVVPLGLALLVWSQPRLLRTSELDVGYWVDEGLSVGIADRPLTDIPGILRQDGSPPLYYMLLHVWMSLTDSGERATHALSLLFALAAVPVAFWGARAAVRRAAPRGSRPCWPRCNPYLSQYAQETRMYSLVVLLSLLATLAASCAPTPSTSARARRWPVLFGLALAVALYTHNWALFLGVAMFVAWLALLLLAAAPPSAGARLRDGALGFGVTALLYLPWVPTLLFQAAHTGAPWSRKPDYEQITMEATHRLLGHTALARAGGGRGRRRGRARRAPAAGGS